MAAVVRSICFERSPRKRYFPSVLFAMNTSLMFEVLLYLNSFYFGFFAVCEVGMNIMKQINLNAYGTVAQSNFSAYDSLNNLTIPIAHDTGLGSGTDFSILLTVCILELVRVYIARKGNLLEESKVLGAYVFHNNLLFFFIAWPVVVAILLTIPSAIGILYLMIWQSWVLRFEYIICCIQLALQSTEVVFGVLSLMPICKTSPYYY